MMLPDLLNEKLIATDLPADRWGAISALLALLEAGDAFSPDQNAEIMADLRAGLGEGIGGPKPFGKEDRSRFLQALDTALVRLLRAP